MAWTFAYLYVCLDGHLSMSIEMLGSAAYYNCLSDVESHFNVNICVIIGICPDVRIYWPMQCIRVI